jgi:hypothetical protein
MNAVNAPARSPRYAGLTRPRLLEVMIEAGGRDGIQDPEAFRAAWKRAPVPARRGRLP